MSVYPLSGAAEQVGAVVSKCASPLDALARLQEDVGRLNSLVAEVFVTLAANLQSISASSRNLASVSQQAFKLLADQDSDKAIATLQQILSDAESMQQTVETSREKMSDILSSLEACRPPLQSLQRTGSQLRVVSTLSRIEGSRIVSNSVQLSTLSDDVSKLASEIQLHISCIADEGRRLAESVKAGVRRLQTESDLERQQARELVQRTHSILAPLRSRSEIAKSAGIDIDQQYAEIRVETDRTVLSLQTEDIARQRVEHIQQALQQAAASLESGEPAEQLGGVVYLQRSQLVATWKLISDSNRAIAESLRALASRVDALSARTGALSSQCTEDGRSFAEAMEEGLTTVSSVLEGFCGAVHGVISTVNLVLPSLSTMASRAGELEEIEQSIELIALNSAIKTAHLGKEGACMAVIASELQSITRNSEGDTRRVLECLRAVDVAVKALTVSGDKPDGSSLATYEIAPAKMELYRLANASKASSRALGNKLMEVLEVTSRLRSELLVNCDLAEQGTRIAEAFESAIANFDLTLQQLGFDPGESGTNTEIAKLSDLYSMESERQIHNQVVGGASALGVTDADEFGDGIELF